MTVPVRSRVRVTPLTYCQDSIVRQSHSVIHWLKYNQQQFNKKCSTVRWIFSFIQVGFIMVGSSVSIVYHQFQTDGSLSRYSLTGKNFELIEFLPKDASKLLVCVLCLLILVVLILLSLLSGRCASVVPLISLILERISRKTFLLTVKTANMKAPWRPCRTIDM